MAGAGRLVAVLDPAATELHRIEVRRHHSSEVITLAEGPATRDGASPAHGGTAPLHENLARAPSGPTRCSARLR